MRVFGKKKDKTVDLTARYMKQKERMENLRENMRASQDSAALGTSSFASQGAQEQSSSNTGGMGNSFGFLDNASSYSYGQSGSTQSFSGNSDDSEKKRKLAKRLMDITDKLEEISNQLYHLQQRVEVLEKKFGSGY